MTGASSARPRRVVVVSAGLRQPSSTRLLADRLAGATERALRLRDEDVDVAVIELRELAHEITDHQLTGFPAPRLGAAIETVAAADGLIAVTPIFSASYTGLFKGFFDVLGEDALAGTPVLVGATGGTARHSLALDHALRPLFAYLRAVVVPTAVFGATEDFGSTADAALATRAERAGAELADLVLAGPGRRAPDPFAGPTPFAELLART